MRETIVLKFGGTSVGSAARVRIAARRVRAHVRRGRRVVVVVSAAGQATDRILAGLGRIGALAAPGWTTAIASPGAQATSAASASSLGDAPPAPGTPPVAMRVGAGIGAAREIDRALATGEDRSAAMLAAALCGLGTRARSLRGGEAGVLVEGDFGAGRIVAVDTEPIRRLLERGVVPVVSGFQGVRADGETLTLGRGGSDTSAVAIAEALGAECHIVTDVDAVYDRDPRLDPDARPYETLDYASLVALVDAGAKVVHPAAARIAARSGVPLRVYHFRAPLAGSGTRIAPGLFAAPAVTARGPAETAFEGSGTTPVQGPAAAPLERSTATSFEGSAATFGGTP